MLDAAADEELLLELLEALLELMELLDLEDEITLLLATLELTSIELATLELTGADELGIVGEVLEPPPPPPQAQRNRLTDAIKYILLARMLTPLFL